MASQQALQCLIVLHTSCVLIIHFLNEYMNEWLLSKTRFTTRKRKKWHPHLKNVKEFFSCYNTDETEMNKEQTWKKPFLCEAGA